MPRGTGPEAAAGEGRGPRRCRRGAGRDRRAGVGRIMDAMEPWEEHAIRRPHLPERVTVYEVGPRDGLQNEAETLSLEAARRVRRRADRGGPSGDRGRLLRLAEGRAAAGRHGGALPAHPSRERRALPGPRAQREGPRARARGRRPRDRRVHRGFRDVQPQEHQCRRGRIDRAVPPGDRARQAGEGPRPRIRLDGVRLPLRRGDRARGRARGGPQAARPRGRRDLHRRHDRRGDPGRRLRRDRGALRNPA